MAMCVFSGYLTVWITFRTNSSPLEIAICPLNIAYLLLDTFGLQDNEVDSEIFQGQTYIVDLGSLDHSCS